LQLSLDDLKIWLHRDLNRLDKALIALTSLEGSVPVSAVRDVFAKAGLRTAAKWNLSDILGSSKGLAIRTPEGWEITTAGRQHLANLGLSSLSPAAVKVASDLRAHLSRIVSSNTRAFVEEAIKCHEAELHRSAIVMSWLAAVDVLYSEVVANHLAAFNAESTRVDSKWKPAKNADDLARMKESDFLDRLAAISVIGKSTKEELQGCLKLRNGCGHPNSLQVGPNKVASHIETLLQNVFERFSH
jgi:hypothetical protein